MPWLLGKRSGPLRDFSGEGVFTFREGLVDLKRRQCVLDGKPFRLKLGAWMFYLPEIEIKLIHARDGLCVCLHDGTPTLEELRSGSYRRADGYSAQEWLSALTEPVCLRAAEAWVAARRLAAAGLGPTVGRLGVVGRLAYRDHEGESVTAGFEVVDIRKLPRKPPCTEEDLARAGVAPDATRSCLRQQKRGWVMDLSSAVPVRPKDAESEVAAAEASLLHALEALRSPR